jgi:hypothetical protein
VAAVEQGPRITDWAEREPELFIGRRATDGDGGPADRRGGDRRQGERRASDGAGAWLAMGLPERRVVAS